MRRDGPPQRGQGAGLLDVRAVPGQGETEETTNAANAMSNWKHAYGWSGHILVRKCEEEDGDSSLNVIVIPDEIFDRIADDMGRCKLPAGVQVEQLGVLSGEVVYSLAAGTGFTTGWKWYGAPFEEAELRMEGDPLKVDVDAVYLAAMREHYGLALPPCRLMVGCSSEH